MFGSMENITLLCITMKHKPSNKPTAQVRILMLNYVIENDHYPNDWFNLNEMEQDFMADKISYEEYDKYVENLLVDWK